MAVGRLKNAASTGRRDHGAETALIVNKTALGSLPATEHHDVAMFPVAVSNPCLDDIFSLHKGLVQHYLAWSYDPSLPVQGPIRSHCSNDDARSMCEGKCLLARWGMIGLGTTARGAWVSEVTTFLVVVGKGVCTDYRVMLLAVMDVRTGSLHANGAIKLSFSTTQVLLQRLSGSLAIYC